MDGASDHPLTNRAAVAEFLRLQNLITQVQSTTATIQTKGMTQLTTASNITDVNAYALSGIEKNATISGSLAQKILTLENNHNMRFVTINGNGDQTLSAVELIKRDFNNFPNNIFLGDIRNSWTVSFIGYRNTNYGFFIILSYGNLRVILLRNYAGEWSSKEI